MDWGLPSYSNNAADSICGYKMRNPLLVTKNRWVYIALCAFNFTFRFIWTLTVFGGVPGYGAGMFFFEVVEVVRRTVWAVFRIEWEVICKVWRIGQHENEELRPSLSDRDFESGSTMSEEEFSKSED